MDKTEIDWKYKFWSRAACDEDGKEISRTISKLKKCNGTGLVLKICETKNNVWKRYILSI